MMLLKIAWVIRNVISYIINLFTRYPLQFMLVLVCLYALHQHNALNRVKNDYKVYKINIAQQAKMQQVKNELLRKQAENTVKDIMATHDESLLVAGLNRKKETDKLKGSINEISNELNIYRDSIQLRNSTSGIGVPKMAEDTLSTSITSGNCHALLKAVVNAGKVTDYDYEALYNLYQKQCNIYGCE